MGHDYSQALNRQWDQLLAAGFHGNFISIWNPDQVTMIAQLQTGEGRYLSMDKGPNGSVACFREDKIL